MVIMNLLLRLETHHPLLETFSLLQALQVMEYRLSSHNLIVTSCKGSKTKSGSMSAASEHMTSISKYGKIKTKKSRDISRRRTRQRTLLESTRKKELSRLKFQKKFRNFTTKVNMLLNSRNLIRSGTLIDFLSPTRLVLKRLLRI